MSRVLPLVRLPAKASVFRFGAVTSPPVLRLGDEGWTIAKDGKTGWAIVGDAEGRRLAVEVSSA
jgi:hypothetical protein